MSFLNFEKSTGIALPKGDKMRFGEYLKGLRVAAELSQSDVAKEFEYSTPQFVSNWERGKSKPPIESIKKLGRLYKTEPNLILKEYLKDVFRWSKEKITRDFQRSK